MVFRRREENKKEEDDRGEVQIPDELITLIAKKFFDNYGDALADMINRKVSQNLEPIRRDVDALKKEVNALKATSDDKIRDLLRTTLEVGMESISERSARKAVEMMGFEKIDSLNEAVRGLKEHQIEMIETLESVSSTLSRVEKTLKEVSKVSEEFRKSVVDAVSQLNDELTSFRNKISGAVEEAVNHIKKNVVVDEGLIETVVARNLTVLVDTKFKDVLMKVEGLSSRVESLERAVKDLKDLEDSVSKLFDELSEIKDLIKSASLGVAEKSLEEKVTKVKEAQDEDVFYLEGEGK